MANKNNSIKNIYTVSKCEVYSTTDPNFENVQNVGTISFEEKNGTYSSIDFRTIDFRTGIVESMNGDLYRISNQEVLSKIADDLEIDIAKDTFAQGKIPQTTYTRANSPTIEIVDTTLTVVDNDNEKEYKIVGMYHSFDRDILENIMKGKMDEIQVEIDGLSDSPEDIAIREAKSNELARARESIEEFGDISISLHKGTTISFVVEGDRGLEVLTFEDVTYDSFKDMTGFSAIETKTPDLELIRSVEDMSKEISAENSSHVYRTSDFESNKYLSQVYLQDGLICGYADGELVDAPLSDVDATISNRGLELTVGGERMLVLSSDDEFARTTHELFAEICDQKELTMLSDQQLTENSQSKIIEQMDVLNITPIYKWNKDGTEPEVLYVIETGDSTKSTKLTKEELLQSVYVSEKDGLIAIRMGDATQILYRDENSLSQTTQIGQLTIDDNNRPVMIIDEKPLYPSFIDPKNNIAICDGTIYRTEGQLFSADGNAIDTPIITGNNDVIRLLNEKVSSYQSQNDRVVNNWDIVSKDGALYLASVEQGKDGVDVKIEQEVKSISMSSDGTLKARFEKGFRVLGTPAEIACEDSVYKMDGKPLSMKETIEISKSADSEGISSVIKQVNDKIKEESTTKEDIVNHQELIRKVPDKWFVVIEDKLYYKYNDNILYGQNGTTLNFDEQRTNINCAFTVSQSMHSQLINAIHEREDINITVKNREDRELLLKIEDKDGKVSNKSIRALHMNDEKIFAIDNDVAKEELAKETESPVME